MTGRVWCYRHRDWERANRCEDNFFDVQDVPDQTISQEMVWYNLWSPYDNFVEVDGVCYTFCSNKNWKWDFKHCEYWLIDPYTRESCTKTTPTEINRLWLEEKHKVLNETEW